ncbi:class I SAM-dependent methyltransferase [Salinarimonas sp.]|uniref:class I SAM-dependent methyltransferase n=1 Tax=Salinarimonas sp. TaxID=2766526 RepID=UPI0032D974D7
MPAIAAAPVDTRFWDRIARRYAARPVGDAAALARTLERTRAVLPTDAAVLELGCGTGTTALRLAPHVGRILATDVSPEMIAIARERAAYAGPANVSFAVAAADDADPGEERFDAVLAFNLVHLLADRRAALRAIHARLKPGGLFVSKTPCLAEMNPLVRLLVPAMRLVGKAPYVAFFTADALERELAEAGFTIVERDRHGSGRKDARVFLVARKDG